ncbi:MAG: leucyl aminopeptidase [Gammaproteobacteria bacterium]
MDFSVKSGNPEKQRSACVVVGVYEGRRMTPAAQQIDKAGDGALAAILRRGDIEGKVGGHLLLHNVPGTLADRVLLVGCGKERELDEHKYREIVARAAQRLKDTGAADAVSYLTELPVKNRDLRWRVRQAVIATHDALYKFDEHKSRRKAARRHLSRIVLDVPNRRELERGERAVREGEAVAAGVRFMRDLANRPPNVCTPSHLAEQAVELARRHAGIRTTVLDEAQMRKLGMGSLLSVSRGSREPARLIVMEYQGRKESGKPTVLVGKGVTFDSGGISLKPGAGMDEMKFDMSGAASVMGTMLALSQLKLPLNVVGIVPTVENMPGGNASRPGDIVTSMSGQTIEILNTDAEGRLILCDAMTYAGRYEPAAVIDVATLTGACVVALGKIATGLFSNHQPLANALLEAGRNSGDRCWQLPLWDDYQRALDSNFADMANVGGREGGSITAACFLARFAEKYHWAHLDIAGTAYRTGKEKGSTGRPVPLLVQYLIDQC